MREGKAEKDMNGGRRKINGKQKRQIAFQLFEAHDWACWGRQGS